KWTVVAAGNAIEAAGLVGNHTREYVEPTGRAFWIGRSRNIGGQRQAFNQWHDVDAAGFQNSPRGEREFVQFQFGDALRHGDAGAWQKTGAYAAGNRPQTQIETGRLNLVRIERPGGANPALLGQRRDHAVGQNSSFRSCEAQSHLQASGDLIGMALRSNPMAGLTQRRLQRIHRVIPWSFEPAGLQPRKTSR